MKKKQIKKNITIEPSSFRDPSGYIFFKNKQLYRKINQNYFDSYHLFKKSGLYDELIDKNLLVKHQEISKSKNSILIKPELVPFISYPYEWSFSQFKDAALLTLSIQKIALERDMSLRDASAYNIQFLHGKPILIDTLSFEKYKNGEPWVAYKQFCQHFLAPLVLMSKTDIRLSLMLRDYIDGIPLDLASKLLPKKTWLNFSILTNIHLHALAQQKFAVSKKETLETKKNYSKKMSKIALFGLIDQLMNSIQNLKAFNQETEWGNYYSFTNYDEKSFNIKKTIIKNFIQNIKIKTSWDLGANNGEFSRITSDLSIPTVAFDIDPLAVEFNYQQVKQKHEKDLLPLIIDLTNPSPSIGWANEERKSLVQRGPVDLVMALALIHHLAISNNLPFSKIAEHFSSLGKYLIIEFVPKTDSKVKILLSTREDIFAQYNQESFEKEFKRYFKILEIKKITNSKRIMYLMKNK